MQIDRELSPRNRPILLIIATDSDGGRVEMHVPADVLRERFEALMEKEGF